MRLLSLDTATEACSAALLCDGQVTERFEVTGRGHTAMMLPMVHGLMRDAGVAFSDLDGLVCGVGPGSFAGVRIATGFIKGLALALDKPVVAVSSLAMLAQGSIEQGADKVLAAIDARMEEIYIGAYERDAAGLARSVSDAQVVAPEKLSLPNLSEGIWRGAGTGWGRYRAQICSRLGLEVVDVQPEALPRASNALKLAAPAFEAGDTLRSDELAPVYLRNKVALTLIEQLARKKTS